MQGKCSYLGSGHLLFSLKGMCSFKVGAANTARALTNFVVAEFVGVVHRHSIYSNFINYSIILMICLELEVTSIR